MTRPPGGSRKALYIVGGVLAFVILLAVSLAFFRKDGAGSTATYATQVQGAVVVAGKSAGTTLDVYEDFLCPFCGRFESKYGGQLRDAIAAGKIQVRYHELGFLNSMTKPAGYSTRAANAAVCAAAGGKFADYHDALFANQPAEMSAGLTDQELIEKGSAVGLAGTFASCVTSHKYSAAVEAATKAFVNDSSARAPDAKSAGTPTVLVNRKWTDISDSDWLDQLTK